MRGKPRTAPHPQPLSRLRERGVNARRTLAALLLTLGLIGPAVAALPPEVARALAAAGIPDTHVGLVVQDLDADHPLLAHGEGRSFNPASVMKLVTTLAALDTLGPAHTFRTEVYTTGEVRGDTLYGNLIVKGRGDPSLTIERFWLLLREVRATGIARIEGDVLLDQACYDLAPIDPGAFDQSPLRPYNAPPAALLVDFNTLTLRLAPDTNPGGLRLWLDPPGLHIESDVRLGAGECNAWADRLTYRMEGHALRVSGEFPAACGARSLRLNLLDPGAAVAAAFTALWTQLGGSLSGEAFVGHLPEEARLLLEFESLPLARIVTSINEYSNNVMAKMLFLDLGALAFGPPARWDKGDAAVRAWLEEKELHIPELVLENGSGLSRIERISAASLARLLRYAASRPIFHEWIASLPALGLEGTLKKRMADSDLAGRAWLKTGSLNGARNLAGYVLDGRGRPRILVFLINHRRATGAEAAQEAAIVWAAQAPAQGVDRP